MLLKCAGWLQEDQTESECFQKSLTFTEYQNEAARCPRRKAMTQKASAGPWAPSTAFHLLSTVRVPTRIEELGLIGPPGLKTMFARSHLAAQSSY